ncbi:Hypothetical predicted protein [Mytilus galloprovincialis]|uniref:G-protein coupled receptors family 1 profile domain-containing protein n=1 Tax=Mytilus galloprovincialis TaxID=29158 RepID=A0A8B6EBD5_MYTGA|nr:Hypothetical predicted protein [Mytilus galloprovincialis]
MLAIISIIVIIYMTIILRVYLSWKRVHPHPSEIRLQQIQKSSSIRNSRKSSLTRQPVHNIPARHCRNTGALSNSQRQYHIGKGRSTCISKRIWKTSVTLGMLVFIMLLSVLPKAVFGLAQVYKPYFKLQNDVGIVDLFLFINPLMDPVVYTLRLSPFRKLLLSKSTR